jgi:hypothetical protein
VRLLGAPARASEDIGIESETTDNERKTVAMAEWWREEGVR